jgi:predicted metal-dependent hydrolase
VNTDTGGKINYKVVYSGRRSMAISIGPTSGVIVRVPYRTSLKAIEKLVSSKTTWINKHLESFRSSVNISNTKKYYDGASTLLYGREHHLKIISSDKYYVRLNGENIIEVGLKNISDTEIVSPMLDKWYKFISEGLFTRRFGEILLKYKDFNFKPTGFSVRILKRRWGSCSSKGIITISSELVKLDDIYLEYVVVHELCHLRHHNHGQEFYNLLGEVFPGWKTRRSELKRYVR